MKKMKLTLCLILILLPGLFLMGCQKSENLDSTNDEIKNLIFNNKNELVVAVNVDGSSSELPFENVWMNRNNFGVV